MIPIVGLTRGGNNQPQQQPDISEQSERWRIWREAGADGVKLVLMQVLDKTRVRLIPTAFDTSFMRGKKSRYVSLTSLEERQDRDLNSPAELRLPGISAVSCATQALLPIIAPEVDPPWSKAAAVLCDLRPHKIIRLLKKGASEWEKRTSARIQAARFQ